MSAFHYELPLGAISAAYNTPYAAHLAGCKATWGTDLNMNLVKVFDGATGKYTPSYMYCDDCNYARHNCGGCGEYLSHEQGGCCNDCARELRQESESGDKK